jgi:hypothetical protein
MIALAVAGAWSTEKRPVEVEVAEILRGSGTIYVELVRDVAAFGCRVSRPRTEARASGLRSERCNNFFPPNADHGPSVDFAASHAHEKALRAGQGTRRGSSSSLGSSGARNVPKDSPWTGRGPDRRGLRNDRGHRSRSASLSHRVPHRGEANVLTSMEKAWNSRSVCRNICVCCRIFTTSPGSDRFRHREAGARHRPLHLRTGAAGLSRGAKRNSGISSDPRARTYEAVRIVAFTTISARTADGPYPCSGHASSTKARPGFFLSVSPRTARVAARTRSRVILPGSARPRRFRSSA